MAEELLSAEEILARLRENAARLASVSRGVTPERLQTSPAPGEWSANEILAHIRASCDVVARQIGRIQAADHPTFAHLSPRTWIRRTDYAQRPFEESLGAFATQRTELLATLEALAPDEWERSATVTMGDRSRERSVRSYGSYLAIHEGEHVRQIEAALRALA
jgi:hypothetical protein